MGTALNIGTYAISHVKLNILSTRARAGEAIESLAELVWDKIVDFFCGTCRDEAKRCLSILYSPRETDLHKVECFHRLKELAGGGFQDRFVAFDDGRTRTYSLAIDGEPELQWQLRQVNKVFDYEDVIRDYVVAELNESRVKNIEANIRTTSGDLPRATFIVHGRPITSRGAYEDDRSHCLEQLNALLGEMDCNEAETGGVYALLGQHLFGTLLEAVALDGSGRTDIERSQDCPTASRLRYELARGDDGRLHCEATLSKDISSEEDDLTFKALCELVEESPRLIKSMHVSFNASIAATGEIGVSHFEIWANDILPLMVFAQTM
ncbi:conserved protein of unknown function [Pararobbsia alpina]|uniref:hypothetical protein n=1 Tax=Pararobbsia alpina TaxID=621374 RepID=UPI0039A513ED